jgi:glycosyltransferase involved in cell wall biosynthesis
MTLARVTVVIPTCGRPDLLPLAVGSALAQGEGDVEVIVVPNGPDRSYEQSLAEFACDPRVRVCPIPTANANAARNHGLTLATGRYVRFLDDDDVLLPDGATRQLEALHDSGMSICTGAVDVVGEDRTFIRRMRITDPSDLFCAMMRPGRICLPTAHLFRRDAIETLRWAEDLKVEQDTDWMFRLSAAREWEWLVVDEVVGRWTQHGGARTSRTITRETRARLAAGKMVSAMATLHQRGALTPMRKDAIAEGIWAYAHWDFYRRPIFWTRMLRIARTLSAPRRPPDPAFEHPIIRRIDPILLEWAMLPKRLLTDWLRRLRRRTWRGA